MRAATEGHPPPVMPQGNLVEVLGREVRKGSPGELMVESSPSRQRRPPCKTSKEMSDEAADATALTYLLTYLLVTFLLAFMKAHISGFFSILLITLFMMTAGRPRKSDDALTPSGKRMRKLRFEQAHKQFKQGLADKCGVLHPTSPTKQPPKMQCRYHPVDQSEACKTGESAASYQHS